MLLAAHGIPSPPDADAVRETMVPVRPDPIHSEGGPPEFNNPGEDRDYSGALTGLTNRNAAPPYTRGIKYVPLFEDYEASDQPTIVDAVISRQGTAAARERSGMFGHGTMPVTDSMEPVIRDGASLGDEYLVAVKPSIQNGAGRYLSTPVQDQQWVAVAQKVGVVNSRKAYQSTLFSSWLDTNGATIS